MIEDQWNMGKLGLFSNNLHAANRLIHQEELQYLRNLTELHRLLNQKNIRNDFFPEKKASIDHAYS
jgi:hypothetical protein